jgi:transposase
MTLHPCFIGIDIAKAHLDVFDTHSRRHRRVPNTPEAIAALVEDWRDTPCLIVFEATGAYDARLRQALTQAGLRFARVNPAQARAFARATGQLAKTDALDARGLAAMGQALALTPDAAPDPHRAPLAKLHKRRDQLVEARAAERTRLAEDDDLADSLKSHIAWLDAEIAHLDARIAHQVAATADLAQSARLLRSVPGVGPVTATTLLALLPELGRRSAKTIARWSGSRP